MCRSIAGTGSKAEEQPLYGERGLVDRAVRVYDERLRLGGRLPADRGPVGLPPNAPANTLQGNRSAEWQPESLRRFPDARGDRSARLATNVSLSVRLNHDAAHSSKVNQQ